MNQQHLKISGIPVMMSSDGDPAAAARRGTILFYHGLGAKKETNLKEYEGLARRGFLAVGVDNAGHGERRYDDFEYRMSLPGFEDFLTEMVRDTVQEIPRLVDGLEAMGLAPRNRLGICGISMGGFIAYGGVPAEGRIRAAAPILGSPVWKGSSNGSPHKIPDRFYPAAILAQNAGLDVNVPSEGSRNFIKKLKSCYRDDPRRVEYVEFPQSGHFMREEDWNLLWENVLNWFDRYLTNGEK